MRIFAGPVMAVLLLGAPARADDAARATQLFNEGRDLLKSGVHAEACARFRESFALDARVGTLMNIASCEEEDGHLVHAHEIWSKAAASAEQIGDARAAFAAQRDAAVVKRIPRLTVNFPPDTPTDARAFVDGVAAIVGTPTTLDPGEHVLTGTATGRVGGSVQISLVEGEERSVIIDLGRPAGGLEPAEHAVEKKPPSLETPQKTTAPSWMRPVGYGAGAVGIAGIAAGIYFFIDAAQKKNESNAQGCNDAKVCTTVAGYDLRSDSSTAADRATASFIAGGLALVGGVALVVLAPRPPARTGAHASLRLVLQPRAVTLAGTF